MLAEIMRKYLPATASERLFSQAGNVYKSKRKRLLPENAQHQMFLHHNLPILN